MCLHTGETEPGRRPQEGAIKEIGESVASSLMESARGVRGD